MNFKSTETKNKQPYFSKELFLKDMLCGNEVVDEVLEELQWIEHFDGEICSFDENFKRNKRGYNSPFYIKDIKHKVTGNCIIIKEEWIEWR